MPWGKSPCFKHGLPRKQLSADTDAACTCGVGFLATFLVVHGILVDHPAVKTNRWADSQGVNRKMPTRKEKIVLKAIELLEADSSGIRYSDLVRRIHKEFPDFPVNTIHGTVWNLETQVPEKVYKPARGLFRHVRFRETEVGEATLAPTIARVNEEDFYRPFADWLVNELEECTKAIALGGNKFKDKWGTPDIIGIREPRKSDIIKMPTEVVSAEVKIDAANLITAFGQACSYKLFSHKSYVVVPKESLEEDIARLDALCRIFGIGLILFDSTNRDTPNFEIRVRAAKHEPDMFYVNKYMKFVEEELFS